MLEESFARNSQVGTFRRSTRDPQVEDTGSVAGGYISRELSTQNSLPSGSASTVHVAASD